MFETYPDYKPGQTYGTGQTVWHSGTGFDSDLYLYTAVEPTSEFPTSTGSSWTLNEPRFSTILVWMITISLCKLDERVSPANITTHGKEVHSEVMMFLKSIQQEKLSPNFPELEEIYPT